MKSPPDQIGALVGVRAWRVRAGRLWSLYRPVLWEPGVPTQAECMSAEPGHAGGHPAPFRSCRCGLYAARRATEDSNRCSDTPESLKRLLGLPIDENRALVLGEVLGWGQAEIATGGWRAQYQSVHALYPTHPEAGDLAETYGVPLVTLT